ncbi:uncharacterized protein LOC109841535 [Asparagus officinalis]|uniref:uncharacterized protein LOC109841535 n=1 Tax=Asparagus officinalis TaxID=4686 RepID=UPI00098DFC7E|nr:uncharacterized protein LOC109841535 [Asparagus officinalis]
MPADTTPSSSRTGNIVTLKTTGREGTVSLHYPLLTKSNYSAWALKMKVYIRAQGVWDAIEPTDPNDEVETRKDQMALAAIYQAISEETLLVLAEKETTKEAWEMLKTMHMGAERVKEAKIQTLRSEFEGLRMREAEIVDDFTAKLTTIVNKIRALGNKVDEAYVVKKLLRVVIASTIEQFAKWKGKEANGDRESSSGSSKGRRAGASCDRGRGCGRNYGRGHNRGGRGNDSNYRERRFDKTKVKCYNCQNFGHFASECRTKEKGEKVHFVEAQEDDDKPALLAMEVCECENDR